MKKVAIFVHAGENEMGGAIHGLVYADEIHAAGQRKTFKKQALHQ